MRIVNVSHSDYANYSYLNAKAMRSVGLDADAFILKKHPFGYPKQANIVTLERIDRECRNADVIVVMHSCGTMETIVNKYAGKKPIVVFHTGTRYRQNKEKYDNLWKNIATKVVMVLGEFCDETSEFMSMTVDDTELLPDYTNHGNLFGHFPSNPDVKGTATILKVFRDKGYPISYSTKQLPYERNKLRINGCDIYIELFAPEQKGKVYGSFGTTALEAAAMGKVVITQNLHTDLYWKHYMPCDGPAFVHTYDDLVSAIDEAYNMSESELLECKQHNRLWVENNHGLIASGNRMKRILGV